MSLYDEFMKSLNTDDAEIDKAMEGLEEAIEEAETPAETDVEGSEVEDPAAETDTETADEAAEENVEVATEGNFGKHKSSIERQKELIRSESDPDKGNQLVVNLTQLIKSAEKDAESESDKKCIDEWEKFAKKYDYIFASKSRTTKTPAAASATESVVEENAPEETTPVEESVETVAEEETPVEAEAESEETAAEEAMVEVTDDEILTEGMESLIFLDTIRATSTKEEFAHFLAENATELELYGLVTPAAIARESYTEDDDEAAMEARNIVRLNREAKISREEARISIGLAKKSNDPLFKYYNKYAKLKREFRDKIYDKYGSRATPLARKAVLNSRNKASLMNSPTASGLINKIDTRLKQLDKAARNNEAIKKDTAPGRARMAKA